MASKLIKPRHNADTPGQKRRGVLSTFYDPRPLKLRKLDPKAVEKFKENIVRVNQSVPFGKMISRGGMFYSFSLRGNSINFRGNTLTPVTSYISLT